MNECGEKADGGGGSKGRTCEIMIRLRSWKENCIREYK